jgi:hypothetical protein
MSNQGVTNDSDDENSVEYQDNNPTYSGVDDEDKAVPPMVGFNNRPLSEELSIRQSLHLTTTKKVLIGDDTELSWDSLKTFRAQCKQIDFTSDLSTVVSKLAFELIILTADGKVVGTDPASVKRRLELDNLMRFTQRQDGEYVMLDTSVWNNVTFCKLLEETFPKESSFKGATSDDFHLRIAQIEPEFSFDDTSKLIDFVRKVKVLVEHYGKHRI